MDPGEILRDTFCFIALYGAYDQLKQEGYDLDTISMGMSEDLDIAIEEGATMVRVGTAIFGPRRYPIPEELAAQQRNPGNGIP